MKPLYRNLILAMLMVCSSALAFAMRPTLRIASESSPVNLETMIPRQFGEWREVAMSGGQIINPQVREKLDHLYTQTLTRTYVNAQGERIMLSIAYGEDQSDAKALHYPEVCYPAQGFQVISSVTGEVKTDFGDIRVRRLLTVLGNRLEPLTYWTTVGNKVVVGGKETKLEQLKYGFKGQIPDGLLFRVSSITADVDGGYQVQQNFIAGLIHQISAGDRVRLAGLSK